MSAWPGTYDVANLKRKLGPAIAELEQRGFLKPFAEDDRFRKVRAGHGEWCLRRARLGAGLPSTAPSPWRNQSPLVRHWPRGVCRRRRLGKS